MRFVLSALRLGLLASLILVTTLAEDTVAGDSSQFTQYPSIFLPLRPLWNNHAASRNGLANFNGAGSSFDSQFLPPGPWEYDGISASRTFAFVSKKKLNLRLSGIRSTISRRIGMRGLRIMWSRMDRCWRSHSQCMHMSCILYMQAMARGVCRFPFNGDTDVVFSRC